MPSRITIYNRVWTSILCEFSEGKGEDAGEGKGKCESEGEGSRAHCFSAGIGCSGRVQWWPWNLGLLLE